MYKIRDIDINKIIYSDCHNKTNSCNIYIKYNDPIRGKVPLVVQLPKLPLLDNITKIHNNKFCTDEFYLKVTNNIVKSFFNNLDNKIVKDCSSNKNTWFNINIPPEYKMTIREFNNENIIKFKLIKTNSFKTIVFNSYKNIILNNYESYFKPDTNIKTLIEISSLLIKNNVCCLHIRLLQLMVMDICKQVKSINYEMDMTDSSSEQEQH